jgi:hypothetical protein
MGQTLEVEGWGSLVLTSVQLGTESARGHAEFIHTPAP